MISLDASALVSLFVLDVHSPTIRGHLRAERPGVGVSDFAVAEFAAVVARRVRAGGCTLDQAGRLLSVQDRWTGENAEALDVEPVDVRAATALVRRFDLGLRAPDAPHLATCQRPQLRLLTFDQGQAAAAGRLGLPLALTAPT